MHLRIDHKEVEVNEGMTLMQAAASAGISIPALCYREGISSHPSCMVCLVKDLDSGRLLPSCTYPVREGMNILTYSDEIEEARREALELLLSDHVGDCEAPCRRSCPAFMDIPGMNRLIAAGKFEEALKLVREEIALPLILGYICPAPCENACRRGSIDGALSICLLKRMTADEGFRLYSGLLPFMEKSGKKVAIIGTGPAGLSAAFYVLRCGHKAVLFDQHEEAGGTLRYGIPEENLPRKALDTEIGAINLMGAEFRLSTRVTKEFFDTVLLDEFDAVIIASGLEEQQIIGDFGLEADEYGLKASRKPSGAGARDGQGNSSLIIPGSSLMAHDDHSMTHYRRGIFACGNIIRKQQMAVRSTALGKAAALSAEHFLRTGKPCKTGKPGSAHQMFNSSFGRLQEVEFKEYLKESPAAPGLEPEKGFSGGFTEAEAMQEAARCLNCDCRKQLSCKLRIYADEYQADQKRFAGRDRKLITKSFQHEYVVYEAEKCIKCGICVEITKSEGELKGMTYVGRGFDVRISVPLGGSMKEALIKTAAKVIEACPTGALAYKIHHDEKRRDS